MKVNIISATNLNNAALDVEVLNLMFKKLRENIEIQHVNWNHYKCPNASINIFLQSMNYQFIQYAKVNVAIIDHENMTNNTIDYLPNMDYVLCKTEYSYSVIETALKQRGYSTNNLVLTGWRSPNLEVSVTDKDFNKVLLYCHQRNSDIYSKIIDAWSPELPNLEVVGATTNILLRNVKVRKQQDNINYRDKIEGHGFHRFFNECGYHLILEDKASYEHLINQCQQVRSIPIALNGGANKELINNDTGFPLSCKKRKSDDERLGSRFTFNTENVVNKFKEIMALSNKSIELIARDAKMYSHKTTSIFETKFLEIFKEIVSKVRTTKKINYSIKEENLPTVSIITPTYNRKNFFPLAIYNYNSFEYPREKLEWIIVDDSESGKSIEHLLPIKQSRSKYNINYIRLDEKHTIGQKRNIAIENSNNSIIVCMDDDDYYYPKSIRNRVELLCGFSERHEQIQAVCCATFAAFEINKYISMINNKNYNLPFYHKLSPATLVFKREFVDLKDETKRFADTDKYEAESLVKTRVNNIAEISWEDNMVALIHRNNISDMRVPGDEKPNGCHFKFNEKLFKFITGLDK